MRTPSNRQAPWPILTEREAAVLVAIILERIKVQARGAA